MATISESFGSGGANIQPGGSAGEPTLAEALRDKIDDLTELRTQFIALLQKIDADSGDTGGDSDYESTLTPAALKSIKG